MKENAKQNLIKYARYFSAFFILMIALPIIYVTNSHGTVGRIIGISFSTIIAYYAIYEVVKHFHLSKITKFLIPLVAPIVFFLPIDPNSYLILNVLKNGSILPDEVATLFNWQVILFPTILLMVTLLDPKNQQSFINMLATWVFLVAISVGISLVFKTLYIINAQTNKEGWKILLFIVGIAIVSDSMALFGGKLFGKHKLAPKISPKKTWEGAIIGYIFAAIFAFLFGYFAHIFNNIFSGKGNVELIFLIISCIILPFISPIGDLAFSAIKRTIGIKDFSNLIPGHGGIMDRFDALSFITMLFALIFYITILVF